MVKNYLFAGIDLLISEDSKIYFIEANSAPYGLKAYVDLFDTCKPLNDLAEFLKDFRCVAIMHNNSGVELEQSEWVVNYLKKKIDLKVCLLNDNRDNFVNGEGILITEDGKKIKPDVLLRQHWSSKKSRPIALSNIGVKIINPISIVETTKDKTITQKAIKEYSKDINCPEQFSIESKEDILELLEKNNELFKQGFVLKPKNGTRSEGVFIFDSIESLPGDLILNKPYILEERIIPLNIFEGDFFDVRAHAINGNFSGCIARVSKSPVTGISAGAKPHKIPEELEEKIKPVVEAIVNAIDKFSERYS